MEWNGTFEVPASGVRVGGRLTINAVESTLTTYGALADDSGSPVVSNPWEGNDVTIPMVWGVTEDGTRLTLLDLVSLGGSLTFPGEWTTRQQWICGSAVEGHIEPVDPVTFSSMSFGLTDLSAWLSSPQPQRTHMFQPPRLDLTVERHAIAELNHGDLIIHFDATFGTTSGFDEITVTYPVRATAISSIERSWHDLVNSVVTPIEVLIWVATGRFSALEDVRVRLDGPHPSYQRLWVSLLNPRSSEPPTRRLLPNEMLFTAEDIPGGVASGVKKWLDIWDDVSSAYGPVIARYRAPFSYSNDRFHAAISALESYSTYKLGERSITKAERNRRIEIVRKALQASAPELTDWVLEALENAHRHTLRTRMNLLLDAAGEISEALVGHDRDGFLTALIRSRDAHAHSTRIVGGLEGGAALHWAAQGLNWLLRYHTLTEIGFDEEEARMRVLTNNTFKQESERLQQTWD